jgi:hypothetical protein
MTTWASDELTKIAAADELRIAALQSDGTLRDPVTIWVVGLGAELYVRSVNGPTAAWFRGGQVRHEGRIWAGGVERDVTLVGTDHALDDQIDHQYRTKYHRYSEQTIRRTTSPQARSTTLRLVPHTAPTT